MYSKMPEVLNVIQSNLSGAGPGGDKEQQKSRDFKHQLFSWI